MESSVVVINVSVGKFSLNFDGKKCQETCVANPDAVHQNCVLVVKAARPEKAAPA